MNTLRQDALPEIPFEQFESWYAEAEASEQIQYASAACLSTVDGNGFPEGRMVIVQAFGPEGFAFFTDRRSPKAKSLEATPKAALTFYWGPFERQIRIQGPVESGTEAEADEYFQRRPRRSQVTAWASVQSQPVRRRGILTERIREVEKKYEDRETLPRPPYWKVYRVIPRAIEFWTAQARRLHDRFLYLRRDTAEWELQRLHP